MPHPSLPPAGIAAGRTAAAAAYPLERTASRQIAGPAPAGTRQVERAIADAARRTSVDFDYLVAQARIESSMDPEARATTSSAAGLYQFIESTWLSTMQRHGARFGLGDIAARIGRGAGGEAEVADPAQRRAILDLRRDPRIAALMAAGLAEDNRAHLAPVLGRQPDHSELYLAHFLGAGGAARFLSEMARDPGQSAAALFPRPAAANRAVFHDANGRERSLSEVMDRLSMKLERARAPSDLPPYLIADEAVFGPGDPPALTGGLRPMLGAPESRPASRPDPQAAPPMSSVLSATFGMGGTGGTGGDDLVPGRATERIRAAYDRLKALGL